MNPEPKNYNVSSSSEQLKRRMRAWLQYQSRSLSYEILLGDFLFSVYAYDSLGKEAMNEISSSFYDEWLNWVDQSPQRKRKKKDKKSKRKN